MGEEMTPKELRALAADKRLDIGTAWNALDAAADRIEKLENAITAIESMARSTRNIRPWWKAGMIAREAQK